MKVFISYSHLDKTIAQMFHKTFTANGIDVLWDGNLTVGSKLSILQNMILDCDVFIVIVSTNSMQSPYVQSEISLALGYMDTRGKPIIPYIRVENNIPQNLLNYQCFMGTSNIELDAINLTRELEKIQGRILAEQAESDEFFVANREVIEEKAAAKERNLAQYTDDVFKRLEKSEKRDRIVAVILYGFSVLFLLVATFASIAKPRAADNADIMQSIASIISSILTLAIVIALSRLSFTLGKAFMTNSIRSGDRLHAISFGKFFIQAYGDEATHDEVRAVFGEWNIDNGTSFHSQTSNDFDPNIMSALEVIKGALTKKEK